MELTKDKVAAEIRRQRKMGGPPVFAVEVAAELVDFDVAAGEYEGCSNELEAAYTEYEAEATKQLGGEA